MERNLAPVQEHEKPPALEIGEDFAKFLLELKEKCQRLNESEWLGIKRQMIRARNYFDGRQYGDVNDACQWVDYPKRPGEISYTVNAYQAHIQTALMEISKGNTDLNFSHVSPDSRYGVLIAKIAESRYKTHRRKLFTAVKQQQENLSLLLNGVAARYTYFCQDSDRSEKIPIMGESDVTGESIKACKECSAPSEGECPQCGSTEVVDIEAPGFKAKAIVGYGEQAAGENEFETVDPLGLIWYLHAADTKSSPFIGWKQAILTDVLQTKYPDIAIKGGIKSVELSYLSSTSGSTPQAGMGHDGGDKATAEFEQWWFDPSLYANYVLKAEIKLRNGTVLPQGTKLGQAFPKGMYAAYNNLNILDLGRESKNDKWSIAPYVTRLGTMVGGGTSAALQDQDTINDLRNLQMASIMNDSFPKEFVDAQYLEPENIPNDPTERAVVTNIPAGQRIIGTAIDRLPPAPLSSDAYAMSEILNGQMQMVLGTFSGTQSGMPDLKAVQDTAAGMQMWREMTIGRFYPMLSVRADRLDKEQALQLLENDQKYLTPQQWEKVKGDYDKEALKAFLNCNLREDLIIEVTDNSFMPLSESQLQANLLGYSKFFAETQGALGDEFNAHAAKLFQIPQTIIGREAQVQTAYRDIGLFREQAIPIVGELGDIPSFDINDPTVAAIAQLVVAEANCPVSFEMDDLNTYMDSLRDWWQTDGGRDSSNVLKAAILWRAKEIDEAKVLEQQKALSLQMAAQAPAMEAQMQMAQQQAAAEAEANGAEAQAQRQHELEMSDREAEARDTDMQARLIEHAANSEQGDIGHQRQMEMNAQQEEMSEREHQRELQRKDKDKELAKAKKSSSKFSK